MLSLKDRKMLSDELKVTKNKVKSLEESLKTEQDKNAKLLSLIEDMKKDMADLNESLSLLSDKGNRLSEACEDSKQAEEKAKETAGNARNEMDKLEKGFGRMTEAFSSQKSKVNKLMEDSKEYTGISKSLQSMVETYKNAAAVISEETKKMGEYAGNMGTLSLNAAIEAGRMGESGLHFVKATDEVRSYAENYEASASLLKEKIQEIDSTFAKSSDSVDRLIVLLKDNTLLLKKIADSCLDEVTFAETFEGKGVDETFSEIDEKNDSVRKTLEDTESVSGDIKIESTDLNNIRDRLDRNISGIEETLK